MIPQIEDHVFKNWNNYFDSKPINLQSLLLSNPQGKKISKSKCIVLIFKNNEPEPSLVCKYSRINSEKYDKVLLENEMLHTIKNDGSSLKVFPAVFPIEMINGKAVHFEQFMTGLSVMKELAYKVNNFSYSSIEDIYSDIEKDFNQVLDFYESSIRKIDSSGVTNNESDYMEQAIKNSKFLLGIINIESEQVEKILKLLEKSCQNHVVNTLPKFVHNDMTPSNIIRNNDNMYLIDFEFSTNSRHAYCDKFRFLFYYFHMCVELNLLPYKSYDSNFYYFFFLNEQIKALIDKFIRDIVVVDDTLKFVEYMVMFLLGNLQLQFKEVDIISPNFLVNTRNLLMMLINLYEDKKIDLHSFEKKIESHNSDINTDGLMSELIEARRYISKCNVVINEKDNQLQENVDYIAKCHETIAQKDLELEKNNRYLSLLKATIAEKDKGLHENTLYIAHCNDTINDKDQQLLESKRILELKESEIDMIKVEKEDMTTKYSELISRYREIEQDNLTQLEKIRKLEKYSLSLIVKILLKVFGRK